VSERWALLAAASLLERRRESKSLAQQADYMTVEIFWVSQFDL
jgi:hypothetical protein